MDQTIAWQRIEGAGVFAGGLALFLIWPSLIPWWAALLIFFAPDISFAAYLAGPRVGAAGYNVVHLYAFGVIVFAAGGALGLPWLGAAGALWLAHSGFDRMLGYGLKSGESFTATHLGRIGKDA